MKRQRIVDWACSLSQEQLRMALIHVTEKLIESEDVRFWDDDDAPYWDFNGEPLTGEIE